MCFQAAVSGSQKIGGIGEEMFLPQFAGKMLIKIPLRKTTYSPCLLGGNYFIPSPPALWEPETTMDLDVNFHSSGLLGGSSQDVWLITMLIYGDRCCPLRIGLWEL